MKNKKIIISIFLFIVAFIFLLGMTAEVKAADEDGNFVVVIDPGHGGSDSGAVAGGLREDYVNFEIAYYLKQELDKYEGVYTYLTRYNTCPTIYERVEFAKSHKADLFISVHNDSGASGASGSAIWVTQDNTQIEYHQKAAEVANKLLYRLNNLGLRNNGVKTRSGKSDERYDSGVVQDYYGVIRYAQRVKMRSLLVEHCYISNAQDRNFLNTKEGLIRLAQADAQGIVEAYQLQKRGQGYIPVKAMKMETDELHLEITPNEPQPVTYLNAILTPTNASNKNIDWYSSNPDVVRVYGNRIRGLKEGTSIIKAISSSNQRLATCKVTVTKPKINLQNITVDKTEQVVNIDQTGDILVNFTPSNCDDKTLYWESSNPDVVRIWEGHFRGLKEGESTITAIARANGKKASCKVIVKDPNKIYVQDVITSQAEYTVNVDQAVDVQYTYQPTNSTNAKFDWYSSNSEIIRVYGNRFRGLKPGTAELIIKSVDGLFEKRIKVTVKTPGKVTDIITEKTQYTVEEEEAVDIIYTCEPKGATNANFNWYSSKPEIVRVWGNRIRGLKEGTAEIIIKTVDGSFEKRVPVTVNKGNKAYVQEIKVQKEQYTINVNEAVDIVYSYAPNNAINAVFDWYSSKPEIMRVWGNRVRGIKEGTAEIIVKTVDGRTEKRIKVVVKNPNKVYVQEVAFQKTEYQVKVNEAIDIPYTYAPSNSTNAVFDWYSSNPEIIRVWGNRVRGLKPGTAEIIVKTVDGSFEKRLKITVSNH